jgi:hypothetical protein
MTLLSLSKAIALVLPVPISIPRIKSGISFFTEIYKSKGHPHGMPFEV